DVVAGEDRRAVLGDVLDALDPHPPEEPQHGREDQLQHPVRHAPDGTRGDFGLLDRAVKSCQPFARMERRLTARGKERRQQLMEFAAARFAEGGYHPTSVAEIVQGLGVGKGVFYWYFDSKEELFL